MNIKITKIIVFICILCLCCIPAAAMESLSSAEMDAVRAGSGVSLSLTNLRMYRYDEYMAYRAVEGDSTYGDTLLKASGILYNDDSASGFWFWSEEISGATFHTKQPVTIDVFNNDYEGGRPMLALQMPEYWQEKYIMIDSLEFAGVEMGPANIDYPVGQADPSSFALYTTPLDSGIGLQLEFGTVFEQFQLRYRYNQRTWPLPDQQDFLTIGDLHIGGYIDGNGNVAGNFQIGDLNPRGDGEYNPMEIHVAEGVRTYQDETGQDYDQRVSFLRLEMPMEGSIRLGTMQIGPDYGVNSPTEFGPIHLDGIKAHRMTVDLIAGRQDI